MALENIGFYTLSDQRMKAAGPSSPLSRCELILTSKCNFHCPYCRHIGGTNMKFKDAKKTVKIWAEQGLRSIRFSGGEPTIWPRLGDLIEISKNLGISRIAISTNGSADLNYYQYLLKMGVDDFSISLDACCSSDGEMMSGVPGIWEKTIENIKILSQLTYVTVGIVLIRETISRVEKIISFAHNLGVADIRIIPAAQSKFNNLNLLDVPDKILLCHPILRYRVNNQKNKIPFRGLSPTDSHRCAIVLDDMAISHGKHYPCIIYMREYGKNIGHINKHMRADRFYWYQTHDTHQDPICKNNCLDVCREYNNAYENFHREN